MESQIQCANATNSMTIGDPPYGQPYPGTTWIPTTNPIGTAPWPGYPNPYIGDLPPVYEPPVKVVPVGPSIMPNGIFPSVQPNPAFDWSGISLGTITPNPWHLTFQADKVVARCDVPGAKLESINVEITNGSISVNYRRFDTGGLCYPQSQQIGQDYDPSTAEATLEAGVLTVTVARFKDKVAHKVTVTAK